MFLLAFPPYIALSKIIELLCTSTILKTYACVPGCIRSQYVDNLNKLAAVFFSLRNKLSAFFVRTYPPQWETRHESSGLDRRADDRVVRLHASFLRGFWTFATTIT